MNLYVMYGILKYVLQSKFEMESRKENNPVRDTRPCITRISRSFNHRKIYRRVSPAGVFSTHVLFQILIFYTLESEYVIPQAS